MSILALALYGSRAREDSDKDSDVDVFALSTEPTYRMIIQNKLNIACYPESLAMKRAREGDLFILHITKEGKIIYDTSAYFQKLKNEFRYKDSYAKEVTDASELGWMLINIATNLSNFTLLNRRIAWCVRTILIAKSAEQKEPCFSAQNLCDFFGNSDIYTLIKNKNNDSFDETIIKNFRNFIDFFGTQSTILVQRPDMSAYQDHFKKTNNIIGLKTTVL